MSKNILVTGAGGMIGRRLIPLLRRAGHAVQAASRSKSHGDVAFDWTPDSFGPGH